jgi:hypothetical protein
MHDPVKAYLKEIGSRGGKKSKGGGRPPKHKTEQGRKEARKQQQKAYRERLKQRQEATSEKND